jgi:cyclase
MSTGLHETRSVGDPRIEEVSPRHNHRPRAWDVCGPELIPKVLAYLHRVLEIAEAGRAAGRTPLEAALACDLGDFTKLHDVERIVGNLHRAYAELDGTPRGGRIDVRGALMDMITYNGGRPLTCLA